jgi:putative NADH-flavin reductase
MKIAVFGSIGGNGRLILAEAMRRGHQVTAFARRPDALAEVTGLATVVEGDARDPADAAKAVAGQDAVIMTVSARDESGASTAIARAVVESMAAEGVRRLVATSAYGMVATRPYVLAAVVRRAFHSVFADQADADQVIEASGLDWTILRATRLTSRPAPTGPARLSDELFTKGPYSLTRRAYAAALVDQAGSSAHIRHIINITGGTHV